MHSKCILQIKKKMESAICLPCCYLLWDTQMKQTDKYGNNLYLSLSYSWMSQVKRMGSLCGLPHQEQAHDKEAFALNGSIIQQDWSCTSSAVKISCGLTCADLRLLNAYVHCLCFRMWRKRKSCVLISLTRRSERRSSSTMQTRVTTLK